MAHGRSDAPSAADVAKGHGAMLLFALVISGSFALGHQAAPHIAPTALNAARFAIGVTALGIAAALGPGIRAEHFRAFWRYPLIGALLAAYFVLMFEALRIAEPVSTSAVFTLIPLMSAGLTLLILKKRTPRGVLAALTLGAVGALWVIFRGDLDAALRLQIGMGERIYFIGCAAHALYPVLVAKLNRGEPPLVFAFLTTGCCGALIWLWAWADGSLAATDWAALPPEAWRAIVYLAVAATALTSLLLQFAALKLPPGKAMAYGYLTPSFVILWQGLGGHGWAAPETWIGAALTAAAMLWLLKR